MQKFNILVLVILFVVVGTNSYISYQTYELTDNTGKISSSNNGQARICFNNLPVIDVSDCDSLVQEGASYSCSITASDEDNNTVTFDSDLVGEEDFFSITSWGYIEFTSNQSHVGSHVLNITADDGQNCGVSSANWTFQINNTNDPPFLETPIPNQEIGEQQSVRIFLTDYFSDPDDPAGSLLTFTKTITSNLIVTISQNSVVITSTECDYSENILFTAKDPYNETADSNVVTVTVNCLDDGGSSSSSSSSGGGGGGGGRSNDCEPQYACGSWEQCTPDGTQRKKCVDIENCDDVNIDYLYKECRYVAHCYNEIMDFDEEDIDCGGDDCKACPSCFDEVQNGDELGVDCGGSCNACLHCTNGILDFDEEKIDCGGTECEACATCEDGIQNGGETGIDCGGNCAPCQQIQFPEPPGSNISWPAYLAGAMIVLVILLLTYKFYRNKLKELIAKAKLFFAGKVEKIILIENIDATNLVRELNLLLEKYKQHGKLTQAFVFDLMSLSREYYVKAFNVKTTIMEAELFPIIDEKKIPTSLKDILKGYFVKLESIERGESTPHVEEFEQMTEEFKQIIYMTSHWQPSRGVLHKKENTESLVGEDKVYALIHNALFALEFGETNEAFKIYTQVIKEYDNLLMVEKEHVYPDLIRLYKEILYAKKIN